MIDTAYSVGDQLVDRANDFGRRASSAGSALPRVRRHATLTTEEVAERIRDRDNELVVRSVSTEVPGPVPVVSSDTESTLRYARLGVVAAVVLVLFLLWVRQRRSRAGRQVSD